MNRAEDIQAISRKTACPDEDHRDLDDVKALAYLKHKPQSSPLGVVSLLLTHDGYTHTGVDQICYTSVPPYFVWRLWRLGVR